MGLFIFNKIFEIILINTRDAQGTRPQGRELEKNFQEGDRVINQNFKGVRSNSFYITIFTKIFEKTQKIYRIASLGKKALIFRKNP